VLLSSENGSIHCFKLLTKEKEDADDDSMNEEFEESDLSLVKDEIKEWRVCSLGSWIQTLFPINYDELVSSEKSNYTLTHEDLEAPNICCMDRKEEKIIMFMKKGEFKRFNIEDGKITEDFSFEPHF